MPLIEKMPSYLFLIRPRRFGKSLFLSMMRTYYDILQQKNFDKYFGDLWIGKHPTDQRNRYQVLYFDFSKAGNSLPGSDMMSSFNEYCSIIINQFAHEYAPFYDADFKTTVESLESAKAKLSYIEIKAKEKNHPLYLIIDEYDNFTNVILSEHGQKMFRDLTHASGFYREYFKQFKGMFDRIFMIDFHRAPDEMVDKNILTNYSKFKMLARIENSNSLKDNRINIIVKGKISTNLHTTFPAERITSNENFCSRLYFWGLLSICGTSDNSIIMCIPNLCVREQYLGFLRDYYQKQSSIDLYYLQEMLTDLAFDGLWKPFFEAVARAYRENSSVRDAMEGERNLQVFLKAYLALSSYYLVEPELEMNYGYCDFFLLPNKQRYPDIIHSYILELKYATRNATDKELEAQAEEGRSQLYQYSEDKKVQELAEGTTLHRLLLQFRGWDMVKCEEV